MYPLARSGWWRVPGVPPWPGLDGGGSTQGTPQPGLDGGGVPRVPPWPGVDGGRYPIP